MHREASASIRIPCSDLGPCRACSAPRGPVVRHGLRPAPYRPGRSPMASRPRRTPPLLHGAQLVAGGTVFAAGAYAFVLALFAVAS